MLDLSKQSRACPDSRGGDIDLLASGRICDSVLTPWQGQLERHLNAEIKVILDGKGGITRSLQSGPWLSCSCHKRATETTWEERQRGKKESFIFDFRLSLEIFSGWAELPPDNWLWLIQKQIRILWPLPSKSTLSERWRVVMNCWERECLPRALL